MTSPDVKLAIEVIGILITWIGFGIALYNVRRAQKKDDSDFRTEISRIARQECMSWSQEPDQRNFLSGRIKEVGREEIDRAMRDLEDKFVLAREFTRFEKDLNSRLDRLDHDMAQRADILASKVTSAVVVQMASMMNTRVFGSGDENDGK